MYLQFLQLIGIASALCSGTGRKNQSLLHEMLTLSKIKSVVRANCLPLQTISIFPHVSF